MTRFLTFGSYFFKASFTFENFFLFLRVQTTWPEADDLSLTRLSCDMAGTIRSREEKVKNSLDSCYSIITNISTTGGTCRYRSNVRNIILCFDKTTGVYWTFPRILTGTIGARRKSLFGAIRIYTSTGAPIVCSGCIDNIAIKML